MAEAKISSPCSKYSIKCSHLGTPMRLIIDPLIKKNSTFWNGTKFCPDHVLNKHRYTVQTHLIREVGTFLSNLTCYINPMMCHRSLLSFSLKSWCYLNEDIVTFLHLKKITTYQKRLYYWVLEILFKKSSFLLIKQLIYFQKSGFFSLFLPHIRLLFIHHLLLRRLLPLLLLSFNGGWQTSLGALPPPTG